MILSHHGSLEHGSPKVPMTPEAVALHAIDTLDTRIHICLREIKDDRGSSAWTQYNQAMQRRLYKGGGGGGGSVDGLNVIDGY
jgi:3'-5' exoribonuclease